jgi:hypothetical protein
MVNDMPNTEMNFCGKHKVMGSFRFRLFNKAKKD